MFKDLDDKIGLAPRDSTLKVQISRWSDWAWRATGRILDPNPMIMVMTETKFKFFIRKTVALGEKKVKIFVGLADLFG